MTNPLRYFFWACSGSTISLLKSKDCETEHSKYVGIGAAVFLTGVLAGVAASYAFYTVFDSVYWAVAFGAFWGVIIFNLDRYLVLSIRKKAPEKDATWRDKLWASGGVLALALPRVALAALLAMVIAKPLELLIFEDEIKLEIQNLKADRPKEFRKEMDEGETSRARRIEKFKQKNNELENQIIAKETEQANARQLAVDEALGRAELPPGEGKLFELKKNMAAAKEKEAEEYIKPRREEIAFNNGEIRRLSEEQRLDEITVVEQSKETEGLATHLQAFSRLTQKNDVVWYANLLIVAIIMILEISPILTKVYADYGPYDKLVDIAEQKAYLAAQQELEDLKVEIQEHRDSYERRKDVLTDIQKLVVKDTLDETQNAKQGSEAQVNLRRAKNDLIEQATYGLTHVSENNNDSKQDN